MYAGHQVRCAGEAHLLYLACISGGKPYPVTEEESALMLPTCCQKHTKRSSAARTTQEDLAHSLSRRAFKMYPDAVSIGLVGQVKAAKATRGEGHCRSTACSRLRGVVTVLTLRQEWPLADTRIRWEIPLSPSTALLAHHGTRACLQADLPRHKTSGCCRWY